MTPTLRLRRPSTGPAIFLACLAPAAALLMPVLTSRAQDPSLRYGGQIPPDVDAIYGRGLASLAAKQSAEGSWTSSYGDGCGVDGICLMAFMSSGEDPNYGPHAATIRRAIRAIIKRQDEKTGYLPDSMYHHGFGMLALSEAYGIIDETLLWEGGKPIRSIAGTLELAIGCAAASAKKNRWGAWRYSPDASDADTSVAGAMLMGLLAARNAGLAVPDETINGAMEYMRRSTGKDGSVAYSGGIGGMGESMNRTAIMALVSAVSRAKESDQFKACLHLLTDNLDHREGSYPEYFRYYMAQALFQGDYAAWQKWNAEQIRQLREAQHDDGAIGNNPYTTGMSLLALALNYRFLPIYER